MHLSESEIRAFQDQELPDAARQRAADHLASCTRCQATAQEIGLRTGQVSRMLSGPPGQGLPGASRPVPTPIHTAHRRLQARLNSEEQQLVNKERNIMSKNPFTRIPRSAWVGLAAILALTVALSFPSVRAAAVSFLGLFRVDQIEVIEVDADRLPGGLDSSSNLENIFSNHVKTEEYGQPQEAASAAEAGQLAGMAVRQPGQLELAPSFYFQPGGSLTFDVDLELVKAVLKDIEREDIELPKELDNAVVHLTVPASVVSLFGDCRYEKPDAPEESADPDEPITWEPKECITLVQMPSPTITAPPELNLAQIGEAYLQLLGLSREEAASFSRNIDWTTTFVIPIPRYHGNTREVTVDGAQGFLVDGYGYTNLIWVKNGVIYALSGPRQSSEMLDIANSLK